MRYRWFAKEEKASDELGAAESYFPKERDGTGKDEEAHPSKGERTGAVFALAVMCYALWAEDLQLFIFGLAVLIYLLHPLMRKWGGERGEFFSNALKGFSLALGWGTIIWVLL